MIRLDDRRLVPTGLVMTKEPIIFHKLLCTVTGYGVTYKSEEANMD